VLNENGQLPVSNVSRYKQI